MICCLKGKSEMSPEIFGNDPLRTLGEILAYCQVTESDSEVLDADWSEPAARRVEQYRGFCLINVMYEAIQKLDEKFELLQARVTHIQEDQIHVEEDQSEIYTLDDTETVQINDESAETTYHVLHHQGPLSVPPSPEGSRTLKLVISSETPTCSSASPQSQTQQSASTTTPRRAVREMLFQQRNLSKDHPNTDAVLAASPQTMRKILQQHRKNPDPQRRNANTEWAQVTYPEHDLREKGKDWKACLTVMNEGARHVRLKDRKRKVRHVLVQIFGRSLQCQSFSTVNNKTGKAVRDTSERTASVHEFKPEPTAEIDVELSGGESEDLQQTAAFKPKREADEELLLESDYEHEAQAYLGQPDREVKVPQLALYSASQRPNPALAARHLIRFMFPEEVLLDEDGPNWKACVYAINGAIRKTRHTLKKCHRLAQDETPMTS
ncbi:hypothetical protein C0J50_6265 [Silurus asotus]|uniref:BEN domain-containing protein n=1 Tax=Silurus asotus TaxID=30991 RepID=A0AAD5A3I3_SILAS|nr:hypothetical protein C0J50_6265 [Silurus asotus]